MTQVHSDDTTVLPWDIVDIRPYRDGILVATQRDQYDGSQSELRYVPISGTETPTKTTVLLAVSEGIAAVDLSLEEDIWLVTDTGRILSNAAFLKDKKEWHWKPVFIKTDEQGPERRWFYHDLPQWISIPTAILARPKGEVLIADLDGKITRLDLNSGNMMPEGDISGSDNGVVYRFVTDGTGNVMAFGTMDTPFARTTGGWHAVPLLGAPDRARLVRARWVGADGQVLCCTSDCLVFRGTSAGFNILADLAEEPFDVAPFADELFIATMSGLLAINKSGHVRVVKKDVEPVLLAPTQHLLCAYDSAQASTLAGIRVNGTFHVWDNLMDSELPRVL
mgnify:CR=1 FL=1